MNFFTPKNVQKNISGNGIKKTSVGNGKNHQISKLQNKNILGNGFCKKTYAGNRFNIFFPNPKKNRSGNGFYKTSTGKGKKSTFFSEKYFQKTYQETAKKNQCRKRQKSSLPRNLLKFETPIF